MEKRKPHYDLITAQAIVARDGVKAFTGTALVGAKTLGLNGRSAYIKLTLTAAGKVVIQFKEK